MQSNRYIGTLKERLAGDYLKNLGYRILEYNFRSRFGEIDIISMDGDTYVFVEVKYRKDAKAGFPEEAVNITKMRRLIQTVRYYMMLKNISDNTPIRFDVIAILGNNIKHYKNAFGMI